MNRIPVAQVSSLLYAEFHSAERAWAPQATSLPSSGRRLQPQAASLRYGRVQLCATGTARFMAPMCTTSLGVKGVQ